MTDPNRKEMLDVAKMKEERTGHMPRGTEEAGMSESTLKPRTQGLLLTIQDLVAFPRHELVTQFKCIEGWSQIVHWAKYPACGRYRSISSENVRRSEPQNTCIWKHPTATITPAKTSIHAAIRMRFSLLR